MSSDTPMSQRTASARPPDASIAATVSWIVPGKPPGSSTTVRAAPTIVAPRAARPIAIPLPMPRDAPVTMTTRSVSSTPPTSRLHAAVERVTRATLRTMILVFCGDFDQTGQLATRYGGSVIDAPTDTPWGLRPAIISDPEGYLWEPSRYQ